MVKKKNTHINKSELEKKNQCKEEKEKSVGKTRNSLEK
jgi:hypothetical protein